MVVAAVALAGCSRDEGAAAPSSTRPTTPVTLPFVEVTKSQLGELLGLGYAPGTNDFLTARLGNRSQLDVTFTIPPAEVEKFIADSKLAAPKSGDRVVSHTSPLWKLNPEGELKGSMTTVTTPAGDKLNVALETVDESTDKVRVRMVVTPK